jgi:FMN reductase
VVGLGGTPRPGSSTERALGVALDAAARAGAETVFLDASSLRFPLYDPAIPMPREAETFIDLVRRADGLIVASPGYHGGPSGLIKNVLDYLEALRSDERPYLDGRAVGCITSASGWQAATTTLTALRSIIHALRGWPTPLGVAINSLTSFVDDDNQLLESVQTKLEIVGSQVASFAFNGPVSAEERGRRDEQAAGIPG